MKKPSAFRLLGFTTCLAGMYFLGKYSRSGSDAMQPAETASGTKVVAKSSGSPGKFQDAYFGGAKGTEKSGWKPFTGSADAFLETALAIPGRNETVYFVYRTVSEATATQLAAWAAELTQLSPSRSWHGEVMQQVVRRWTTLAPDAALAWAKGLPENLQKTSMASVIAGIAETSPDRAESMLEGLETVSARKAAAVQMAEALVRTDPAKAVALMQKYGDSNNRYQISQILSDWAVRDPLAALQVSDGLTGEAKKEANNRILYTWAGQDPAAAMAYIGNMPKGKNRDSAVYSALQSWANKDPEAAWSHLQALPANDLGRKQALSSVLGIIANKDPQRALALTSGMKPKERNQGIQAIAASWAGKDFDAALAYATGLTNKKEKEAAMQGVGGQMDLTDDAKTKVIMENIPEGKARTAFVRNCVSQKSYSDPKGAAALLNFLPPQEQAKIFQETSLMHYLSREDPVAALAKALEMPGSQQPYSVNTAISALATTDPAKALEIAATLTGENKSQAYQSLYAQLVQENGPGTMAQVMGMTDAKQRDLCMQSTLSAWSQSDPDAVIAWAGTANAADRQKALTAVLPRKAQDDPVAAATLLLPYLQSTQPGDMDVMVNSIDAVTRGYFSENPQQAVAWVNQLPTQHQDNAIQNLANQWCREDPVSASEWIHQMPTSNTKDGAIGSLVQNIRDTDPGSAAVWASSITNESQRNHAFTNLFGNWLVTDKPAALQALQVAPISASQREQLIKQAERR